MKFIRGISRYYLSILYAFSSVWLFACANNAVPIGEIPAATTPAPSQQNRTASIKYLSATVPASTRDNGQVGNPPQAQQTVLKWKPFTVTNSFGDPATQISNFTVTAITDRSPTTGFWRTTYYTSWNYYNYSEDDRYKTFVSLDVDILNDQGQVIDSYHTQSYRGTCTYGGPATGSATPVASDHNYMAVIYSGRVRWTYSSPYEGRC